MRGTERVRLEFRNPRYPDRELEEHLLELILYSRYAGINLEGLHKAVSKAVLVSGQEGPELKHGGGLVLETDFKTSNLINQLVQMYPVFSTWDIKVSKVRKSPTKGKTSTKEITMAAKKKAAKKKPAKKKAATKKAATKKPAKKKAATKKAAKKKPAKKKAATKKAAKKKPAKKKAATKKAATKKPAKKKAAKKKPAKKKAAKKK